MTWLTLIWAAVIGACLMQALTHLLVWNHNRRSWAHLCFVITVASTAGLAAAELLTMHASSPAAFGQILRWAHLIFGIGVAGSLGFVHFFFGTGQKWLLMPALGFRCLAVMANFTTGVNLHTSAIHSLDHIPFLGSQVAVLGDWQPNPWVRLGQTAALFQLLYVLDAAARLRRQPSPDSRRRALVMGGSLATFILIASAQPGLVAAGLLHMPLIISMPFLGMTLAMGYELSRDVLSAARLSRQLQTSEQRLAMAASAARLALWEWDLRSDRIWVSPNGHALYGVEPSESVDFQRFTESVHPDDRQAVRAAITTALDGGGPYQMDYRITLPDGQTRWMAARGTVEQDAQGKALHLRGVSLDITEQKESEDRFRSVIEAAPNPMVMIDARATIHLVNAQTETVFGYSRAELLGAPLQKLVPASTAAQAPLAGSESTEPSSATVEETTGHHKNGTEVPVEIRLSPAIRTPQGEFVLASIIDVTRRRLAEQEAAHQRTELAHLSRVSILGELSGSLAHELNQPLAAILSNSQVGRQNLLSASPDPAELAEIFDDITADAKRAGGIIHGMRQMFSKTPCSEAGPVSINTSIQQVLHLLNSEIIARQAHITLHLQNPLPPVQASSVEIQQILINLIVNSLEATRNFPDQGRISLTTAQQNHSVVVSVRDNGPGLTPAQSKRLFEPFATTKTGGLGLGLVISRRLAERFGGTLEGANHPEGGALFQLVLPAAESANPPLPFIPHPPHTANRTHHPA